MIHTTLGEIMKNFKSVISKILFVAILVSAVLSFGGAGYVEKQEVYLGGMPLGIELESTGVVVTDTFDVLGADGVSSPSKEAGLVTGDVILSVNDKTVSSAKDISDAIKDVKTDEFVKLKVVKNGKIRDVLVFPVYDTVNKGMRIGVSVTEGITGVGTLTFVTKDGKFGGLGHKITDEHLRCSGQSGEIYKCSIFEVTKGKRGKPGELHGMFHSTSGDIGKISVNNDFGVFGTYSGNTQKFECVEVGSKQYVKCGKAYIYSTVSGDVPRRYEIEIEKISDGDPSGQKGLVIRVTDKRLLDKSGGIVRGMSGSPIIQDNKLIGAVTHVLINDPTAGYGVFIENMLEQVDGVKD